MALFLIGLLALANLATIEFASRLQEGIAVDELYFSACAVHGLGVGQLPVSGCHDNKGPVIFLVHQLVQFHAQPYSAVAMKAAALGVVALIVALGGGLGLRFAGRLAGIAAAGLVALAFAVDADHLALKTESVGAVFLLLAVLLCTARKNSAVRWLGAGCLFGLAVLSKQTYGFGLPAFLVWAWLAADTASRGRCFRLHGLMFLLGMGVPFATFGMLFLWQGTLPDALASLFLYPSIYGQGYTASPWKVMFWRWGGIAPDLASIPLVTGLFAVALPLILMRRPMDGDRGPLSQRPELLIVLLALSMLVMLMVSPVYFRYHIVPAWILMAVVAGIVLGKLGLELQRMPPGWPVGLSVALVVMALVAATASMFSQGSRKARTEQAREEALIEGAHRGEHAYVLGMWPQFYVYNGLVPATSVQFPWALPGAPPNAFYSLPPGASVRGRALAQMRERNLRQLFNDFARTPPSYIVVAHEMARAPGSRQLADVPGFDEYLRSHCIAVGRVADYLKSEQSLYRCNSARDRAPVPQVAEPPPK